MPRRRCSDNRSTRRVPGRQPLYHLGAQDRRTGALTELRRKRWQDVSLDALASSPDEIRPAEFPDPAPGPAQAADKKAVTALLHRYIHDELTERQRSALLAVGIYGMPLEEVAHRMGSTRNAMYKLLHDAGAI